MLLLLLQSRSCILKDCCYIEDNTVLPPETVVPPFMIYSGNPGHCVGVLSASTQEIMADTTKAMYQHFKPIKKNNTH